MPEIKTMRNLITAADPYIFKLNYPSSSFQLGDKINIVVFKWDRYSLLLKFICRQNTKFELLDIRIVLSYSSSSNNPIFRVRAEEKLNESPGLGFILNTINNHLK